MNSAISGTSTVIRSPGTCTNMGGAVVTITVTQAGRVFVQALTWLKIEHTSGTRDIWAINIGTTNTDCGTGVGSWVDEIPADVTDAIGDKSAFVQRVVPVPAGTHSFYLNGWMSYGASANDRFHYSNIVAVFYPS